AEILKTTDIDAADDTATIRLAYYPWHAEKHVPRRRRHVLLELLAGNLADRGHRFDRRFRRPAHHGESVEHGGRQADRGELALGDCGQMPFIFLRANRKRRKTDCRAGYRRGRNLRCPRFAPSFVASPHRIAAPPIRPRHIRTPEFSEVGAGWRNA